MTKSDCQENMTVPTTASGGTKTIKIWFCTEWPEGIRHYFLDNGAECTDLITEKENSFWYIGGGWLETFLSKSFKGTSRDIDKLKKWIIYSAIAAVISFITLRSIYKALKNKH